MGSLLSEARLGFQGNVNHTVVIVKGKKTGRDGKNDLH